MFGTVIQIAVVPEVFKLYIAYRVTINLVADIFSIPPAQNYELRYLRSSICPFPESDCLKQAEGSRSIIFSTLIFNAEIAYESKFVEWSNYRTTISVLWWNAKFGTNNAVLVLNVNRTRGFAA